MENTLIRGDGVPMTTDTDDIDARIARAEYAAIHIANNGSLWIKYYEDRVEDNRLINDFKALVRENKTLRGKLSDAANKLESLGSQIDE